MKTTESGIMVTIKAWVPCDLKDVKELARVAGSCAYAMPVFEGISAVEWQLIETTAVPIARRVIEVPASSSTASAVAGTLDGTVAVSPEAATAAADPLEIPESLRRVPRPA